ncbi:MFS transporter [Nonomuraea turkmeniaca]|uniref:MFS transporter n=1 Tax=Nonomuraea turkmeniaca TaxID=103838 RepID=A0A5S4F8C6_9ACTN|nr:MFS transporter [Nonomuraea turkmeniaca]TMR12775.1 MFS transporter [Nonomuraea turkmeniaca]
MKKVAMSHPDPDLAPPTPVLDSGETGTRSLRTYLSSMRIYPAQAWKAAIACVLAMALSPAALVATITFLVGPISADYGWSRAETLSVLSLPLLAGPLMLPLAGRWTDRWGARAVAIPAMLLYGLTTAAVMAAGGDRLLLILPLLGSTVFGYFATMGVVYKVVSAWFTEHRGIAFSLLIGGSSSLAGAVLAPLCETSIDAVGWRGTYLLLGAAILLIGFPAQIFLLSEPEEVVRARGTGRAGGAEEPAPELPGAPMGVALRSRTWIFIMAILGLGASSIVSVRQNAVPLFGERGYSEDLVAFSLSALLISSIVGQIVAGLVLDRARTPGPSSSSPPASRWAC